MCGSYIIVVMVKFKVNWAFEWTNTSQDTCRFLV